MQKRPLVFFDTRPKRGPSNQVREIAAKAGVELKRIVVTSLEDVGDDPGFAPLLVLIAPDVTPLFGLARRARALWPDVPIVFMASTVRIRELRDEMMVRGVVGDLYSTLDCAALASPDGLARDIAIAQKRRSLQVTLSGINAALARKAPERPDMRRVLEFGHYLRSVLENAPDAVIFLDANGIISAWNRGATTVFGHREESVLGRPLDFLSCPTSVATEFSLTRALSVVMDGESTIRGDHCLCTSAQERVDVDATIAEIRDDDGQRLGFSVFARDITARKRYQELLEEARERLTVTLHSIGDGVITTDTDGLVTFLNPVAEALCGWPLTEAVGKPLMRVFDIVSEATRAPREDPVKKVLATGETVELANHTLLISRAGTERAIADSGAPIRDGNGRILGAVLVFRDVTEKQRIENALLRDRQLEAIGLLAGGIAHDFNNILTALFGNISLVRLHVQHDASIIGLLDQVDQAFYRARDLAQQLLTFAKGGAPIKKAGALREFLSETVKFLLHGTPVVARYELPDDLWAAEFDAAQMSQAFSNILLNAVQAMPKGGTITVAACNVRIASDELPPLQGGRYICVSIIDNGLGIPEADRERIFHPYFTTKESGTGLGLATTYSVIRRHGGHIVVRPNLDQGTCFDTYLPAAEKEVLVTSTPRPGPISGSGRILVMDDEEPVRKVCTEILRHLGYEVEAVADGCELVALYKDYLERGVRPDVVIVDLKVPGGMDGREAAVRIRALDAEARLLVSSGYSTDPIMADYRSHGFVGVIAKPYDIHELAATVRRTIPRLADS